MRVSKSITYSYREIPSVEDETSYKNKTIYESVDLL